MRVDGALAKYLRLEEGMTVEGNESYLREILRERVRSDTDLSLFPRRSCGHHHCGAGAFRSLQLEVQKGSSFSSRGEKSWKLQQFFLAEQAKEAHRRNCAASRQRVSCGEI